MLLDEASHDTMSHFVACGILLGTLGRGGGGVGRNVESTKRPKGIDPMPVLFCFYHPWPEILGMAGAILRRDRQYLLCTRFGESAPEKWPDRQVHHVAAPVRSWKAHKMSQLRGRWFLPLPVKALITSNLISTQRVILI